MQTSSGRNPEGFSFSFLINDSAKNPVCSIGETWNFSNRSDPRTSTGFLTSQCCKSFLEHLVQEGNTLISFCPNRSDFQGSTTDFFHHLSIQDTAFLQYSESELGQLGFSKGPRFVAVHIQATHKVGVKDCICMHPQINSLKF